jgi:2-dehydropantoate 2-reductase
MRFLFFGAGAIGSYIGGSLSLQGHSVTFLERPEAVAKLRARGLSLDLSLAGYGVRQVAPSAFQAESDLEQALAHGPFDLAIFALKSFDTPAAAEAMRPWAEQFPPLLCLSNGVENETILRQALGEAKVIEGTVTSAVSRTEAGIVRLEKWRGMGWAASHPEAVRWQQVFAQAGLRPRLYADGKAMKWSKLLTNLLANASSAILDMTPGAIFAHPGLYALEMEQLREALAVLRAQHLQVVDLPGTPVRLLAFLAQAPSWLRPLARPLLAKGRGQKMPSLHIDLYAGRRQSEVHFLNGAVVRFGEQYHVPVPTNRLLNDLLSRMVQGELPREAFAHQPQKLLEAWARQRQSD